MLGAKANSLNIGQLACAPSSHARGCITPPASRAAPLHAAPLRLAAAPHAPLRRSAGAAAPRRAAPALPRAMRGGGGGGVPVPERVIAALPYLLPLFDGLRYGKFLMGQFPVFAQVIAPLNPVIGLYYSVPFAGAVAFFGLYLGVINNQRVSRFARFAAMQAVLLDIVLILPGLVESVLRFRPAGGPALQLYITTYNSIYLYLFACVVYGVGAALAGREARLPFLAEAADAQVR